MAVAPARDPLSAYIRDQLARLDLNRVVLWYDAERTLFLAGVSDTVPAEPSITYPPAHSFSGVHSRVRFSMHAHDGVERPNSSSKTASMAGSSTTITCHTRSRRMSAYP
jgi:hypothetical protein